MKIRELLEGDVDPADPRGVRPTTATGKVPVPSNFTTPVLAPSMAPSAPTPVSPVSSTAPGGPPTALDMRNMAPHDGLPTEIGVTAGMAPAAGVPKDTSIPELPARRNP